MASQNLNVTSEANSGGGTGLRNAFINVRKMFAELYNITYSSDTQDISGTTFKVPLTTVSDQAANTVVVNDSSSSGALSAKAVTDQQILIGDGTGFTAAALSGDVTMANTGAVTIASTAVETGMLANDSITYDKLGVEFTASVALSSAATIAVNTSLADVFTYTAGHSATLNFTDVGIGDIKTFVITGGGGSYTLTLGTINGSSGTYNALSSTAYSDTGSAKNLVQIKFVSTSEAWYQISQIAS